MRYEPASLTFAFCFMPFFFGDYRSREVCLQLPKIGAFPMCPAEGSMDGKVPASEHCTSAKFIFLYEAGSAVIPSK